MSIEARLSKGATLDTHAANVLLTPNPRLQSAIENSTRNNIPTIAISPLQGQYLAIQAQLIGAKNILEIGTLGGYSSIWFASSGAKVTSLEINPDRARVARENTEGLDVEVVVGSAVDTLPKLVDEGKVYDMVFIDADWERQAEYFAWAVQLTRIGGIVYVDNVVREIFETSEETGSSIAEEKLLNSVGKDKRVQASLISTLSSHKAEFEERYDGFVIAIVKGK